MDDHMHVRFSADFRFVPPGAPNTTIGYQAGWKGSVLRSCGEAAIAAGVAKEIPTPARQHKPAKGEV